MGEPAVAVLGDGPALRGLESCRLAGEDRLERLTGKRGLARGHLLRHPRRDNAAAPGPAFRSEVDYPVRGLDHVQVVLDDQHRIAGFNEPVEHREELPDVLEVESRCWLVEDVERAAGPATAQLSGQLDPLGFAAGEGRGGLTEMDIVQADVVQRLQHTANLGHVLEQLQGLLDVHLQHVVNTLPSIADLQRFAVEAFALTDRAGDPDVREEIHLQLVRPVPLASFAPAAGAIEAEPAGLVAAHLRVRHLGEVGADLVEDLDVGRRVRSRGAPDRRLVDVDDLVHLFGADDSVAAHADHLGLLFRQFLAVLGFLATVSRHAITKPGEQDFADQRTFPGPADAGHADELAQWEFDIDVLQVVVPGAFDADRSAGRRPAFLGQLDLSVAGQVPGGHARRVGDDIRRRSGRDNLAAANSRSRTEIDQEVRRAHRLLVVLNDEDRVPHVAQPLQAAEQPFVVARVQSDGRLVQDVEHADQPAADLAR